MQLQPFSCGKRDIAIITSETRRSQCDGGSEFRGECAIKTVAKRKRIFFRFQGQGRQLGKETANDLFVFFALKAACAVNQYPAGFQQAEHSARDDQLFVGHSAEIFRSESPSHVNPSAHDSGICAWRI